MEASVAVRGLVEGASAWALGGVANEETLAVAAIRVALAVAEDVGKAGSNACNGGRSGPHHYDTRSQSVGTTVTEVSNVISALGANAPREWYGTATRGAIPRLSEHDWAVELGVREDPVARMSAIGKALEEHLAYVLSTNSGGFAVRHRFLVGKDPRKPPEPRTPSRATSVGRLRANEACSAAARLLAGAGISVEGYQVHLYKALDASLPCPETFSLRGEVDFIGIQRTSEGVGIAIVDLKVQRDVAHPEKSHALQNFIYRQLLAAMAPEFRLKARCYILHMSLTEGAVQLVEIKCKELEVVTHNYLEEHPKAAAGSAFWTLIKQVVQHEVETIPVRRLPQPERRAAPEPTPEPATPTDAPAPREAAAASASAAPTKLKIVTTPREVESLTTTKAPRTDDPHLAVTFLRLVAQVETSDKYHALHPTANLLVPVDFVGREPGASLDSRLGLAVARWLVVRDTLLKHKHAITTKEDLLSALRGQPNADVEGKRVNWGYWVGKINEESAAVPLKVSV